MHSWRRRREKTKNERAKKEKEVVTVRGRHSSRSHHWVYANKTWTGRAVTALFDGYKDAKKQTSDHHRAHDK
jgi:hypothetical protein